MDQIYTYTLKLDLSNSSYFNKFKLKKHYSAKAAEILSESFDTYQQCVDDCNALMLHFKKMLEKRNKNNTFNLGWEVNPKRNKDAKNSPTATPFHLWNDSEIVHIFLFDQNDPNLKNSLIKANIEVKLKEEFFEESLH